MFRVICLLLKKIPLSLIKKLFHLYPLSIVQSPMLSLKYQVLHIHCPMTSISCLIVRGYCPISRVQCTFLFGPMDTCQSHLHYSASIYDWQFGDRHYSLPHFCSLLPAFRCHHKTQNTQKGAESRGQGSESRE